MTIKYLAYFAAFLSVAPIFSIIFVREAILRQRQFVIQALARALSTPPAPVAAPSLFVSQVAAGQIPALPPATPPTARQIDALASFEIVKFKYFLDKSDGPEGRSNRSRDFRIWQWVVTAVPLAVILFLLYFFVIFCIARRMWTGATLDGVSWIGPGAGVQWIIAAGFAGSQLNMLSNLFRAVNNFDLSPSTFIESMIDILLGVVVGVVVYYCAVIVAPVSSALDVSKLTALNVDWGAYGTFGIKAGFLFLIAFAFVTGYYPDVVKRNVVRAVKLNNYKLEDDTIFNKFEITPVEIVDGIDSTIRKRLEDFHIFSIQNLATANPLMLYVETPYGVYQTLDWVAQAQLISVFGPRRIEALWTFGVRTIFDLERVALDDRYKNANLRRYIAEMLVFDDAKKADIRSDPDGFLRAVAGAILDAPHTRRLRQIVMILAARIGHDFDRLPTA